MSRADMVRAGSMVFMREGMARLTGERRLLFHFRAMS
jgi:hypothetical protein